MPLLPSDRQTVLSVGHDSQTMAIIAAMTTTPTAKRQRVIQALVHALKDAGVWPLLDLLYVLAAADSQAALINWRNPGTFTASVAAGSPTFTVDHGYTGNGTTTEITTGWNTATHAKQLLRDSAHVGVYALTFTASLGATDFGYATTSNLNVRAGSNTALTVRVNDNTLLQASGVVSAPQHAMGLRRDASNHLAFRQGVQNATAAVASLAIPNATNSAVSILKANAGFSDRQIAAAHLGAALNDAQALALYTALLTYMRAVGAHT